MSFKHFNPRSPQGERRFRRYDYAPHTHFNPRSPQGERRALQNTPLFFKKISIHAPRRGSDSEQLFTVAPLCHFNPRSPQGERRAVMMSFIARNLFQSTLPAGGATQPSVCAEFRRNISIHAPRRGSDHQSRIYLYRH